MLTIPVELLTFEYLHIGENQTDCSNVTLGQVSCKYIRAIVTDISTVII